jgi:uncharacterized repeat protein (TIGR03803 family)
LAMILNPCSRPAIRAVVCFGIVLATCPLAAARWKEKVLYSFQGGNDGAVPAGGVVFDKAGNLYGATTYTSSCSTTFECGTVFELSPPLHGGAWTETTLHVFQGHDHGDGGAPGGGVILDAAGNVYGTTAYGGSGPCMLLGTAVGCGAVYEMIAPAKPNGTWKEKILYNFQGNKDGQFPTGDLVFDKSGNLYGATDFGGGYGKCDAPYYQHCGTIFELVAPKTKGGKWKEKVLYSFKGGKDGASPNGGLIFDGKGAMYGSTYAGGNQICQGAGSVGCGTVFMLSPTGEPGEPWTENVIYRFKGRPNDGSGPNGSLALNAGGTVFGTTVSGGSAEEGVIFRLEQVTGRWVETILHTFLGGNDEALPMAGVTFDSSGDLYGTTTLGGFAGGGGVYELKRPVGGGGIWTYVTRYLLKGAPDGSYPASKLTVSGPGALYGTTRQGGTGQSCGNYGCGTVFEVWP